MKTWLIAVLGASLAAGAGAQEAPGQEEGTAGEEDEEDMVEMQKSSGKVLIGVDFVYMGITGNQGDGIGPGLGGDVWAGYEIPVGDVGIVPRLAVGYEKFLEKDGNGGSLVTVFPGAYVTLHIGDWAPWIGIGLGMGSFMCDTQCVQRESKFAFDLGAGANYRVSDTTAVGGFIGYDIVTTPGESLKIFKVGLGPQFVF